MGGQIGQCRLCLRPDVKLIDGHVAPAWAYRRIVSDLPKPARPVYIHQDAAILTDKQITEYMLCKPCEDRFGVWEKYASKMLVQEDGSFPWVQGTKPMFVTTGADQVGWLDSSALETEKLAAFAASVVWRASISKDACPHVCLGPFEEPFRRHLVGEAPFPTRAHLTVFLHAPSSNGLPPADRMMTLPKTVKEVGYRRHWFLLCGASFHLHVGSLPPGYAKRLCFVATKHVAIMPSDQIVELCGRTVMASKARGLLAKMKERGEI
jgi:hypothetical protein